MVITSFVILSVSMAFSFSMRIWEKETNRPVEKVERVIDMMKRQLACWVEIDEGKSEALAAANFKGDEQSFTFLTACSVKSLGGGVPVIAKYFYDPDEKTLYYAEYPAQWNDEQGIEDFLGLEPDPEEEDNPFHGFQVEELYFTYFNVKEGNEFELEDELDIWEDDPENLGVVVVNAKQTPDTEMHRRLLYPHFLGVVTRGAVQNAGE